VLCFDYDHEIPTLQRLITLSGRAQWSVEDIDWTRKLSKRPGEYEPILEWHGIYRNDYIQSLTPSKREALARQLVAYEFSQILHGEQAALMLAGQLTSSVRDLDARIFAANQARDEARHVLAVRDLVQRLGPIYAPGAYVSEKLDELLESKLWPKQVLGLQLFMEARALLAFRQTLLFVRDPLFLDVTMRIERDEAHHVAFGIQYLRTGIAELGPDERAMLVAYARKLDQSLWLKTNLADYRGAFEEVDLDFDDFAVSHTASFLAPAISLDKVASVETMHIEFRRWFENATRRVGLGEALPSRGTPSEPEGPREEDLEAEMHLPWIEAAAPPKRAE
jgi:para-aminobenzoate N-oxygenase AurF